MTQVNEVVIDGVRYYRWHMGNGVDRWERYDEFDWEAAEAAERLAIEKELEN